MPPQLLSLIIFGIQQLITHEPEIAAEIKDLFTKGDPTAADWTALHAKVQAKSYADYVPASALTQPAPASAPVPASTAAPQAEPVPVNVVPMPAASQSAPAPLAVVASQSAGASQQTAAPQAAAIAGSKASADANPTATDAPAAAPAPAVKAPKFSPPGPPAPKLNVAGTVTATALPK